MPAAPDGFVGLDLSGQTLRAMHSPPDGKLRFGERVLPPGMLRDATVVDKGGMGAEIRALAEELGFGGGTAGVAIGDRTVTVRLLDPAPGRAHAGVVEAVGHDLPLRPDTTIVHSADLPGGAKGERRVFAVITDRTVLAGFTDAVAAAGLKCAGVFLRSQCAAKVLGAADGILVGWDASEFEVVFLEGGVPRLSHAVPAGSPEGPGAEGVAVLSLAMAFHSRTLGPLPAPKMLDIGPEAIPQLALAGADLPWAAQNEHPAGATAVTEAESWRRYLGAHGAGLLAASGTGRDGSAGYPVFNLAAPAGQSGARGKSLAQRLRGR
ncbi:MAG: hypothetical protein ABR573_05955 [Candidatus Dormibacteria bacterium]